MTDINAWETFCLTTSCDSFYHSRVVSQVSLRIRTRNSRALTGIKNKMNLTAEIQPLSPSEKQRRNPCSGPPPVYQDLCTRHDWSIKKAIVNLPIKLKVNSRRTSGDSLSPLRAQNKDKGAAFKTVGLRLRRRLEM